MRQAKDLEALAEVGRRVNLRLSELGASVRSLERQIGLPQSTIAKLWAGVGVLDSRKLELIAAGLRVTSASLVAGTSLEPLSAKGPRGPVTLLKEAEEERRANHAEVVASMGALQARVGALEQRLAFLEGQLLRRSKGSARAVDG